jgi:hypothetical protein
MLDDPEVNMYKAICYFTDAQDGHFAYHTGDTFPREGMTVSEERLQELTSSNNKQKKPLIAEVGKEKVKTDPEVEAAPAPKAKAKRTTKKKD